MRWEPKSEEEVQAGQICPEGKQPFTVLEASAATSKKGKDMFKLKLNVHADDGFDYHVYDYISPFFMAFRFRHFFFSVGRGADYEAGTIDPAKLVGKQGYSEMGREEYNGKPKAIVSDYIVDGAEPSKAKVAPDGAVAAAEPDDVPF